MGCCHLQNVCWSAVLYTSAVALTYAAYMPSLRQSRSMIQGFDSSQAAACRHTSGWERRWLLWQRRECWCWALA